MKTFICPSCNKGEVRDVARAGRRMHFRTIPDLEVPATVAIPTCANPECGEEWIDRAVAARIDEAMKEAYQAALTAKAEAAISKLKKKAPQRDLERLLGVSAGYLSKLKQGKETTAPLVAALVLLAADLQRVDELRSLWAMEHVEEPSAVRVKITELSTRRRMAPVARSTPATATHSVKLEGKSSDANALIAQHSIPAAAA